MSSHKTFVETSVSIYQGGFELAYLSFCDVQVTLYILDCLAVQNKQMKQSNKAKPNSTKDTIAFGRNETRANNRTHFKVYFMLNYSRLTVGAMDS